MRSVRKHFCKKFGISVDACVEQLVKYSSSSENSNDIAAMNDDVTSERLNRRQEGSASSSSAAPSSATWNNVFRSTLNSQSQSGQRQKASTSAEHPQVQPILEEIGKGYRVMIFMRGAPGSGKSHLAQTIVDRTMDGDYANHIFSTDDFFYDPRTKQYNYNRQLLGDAHDKNQFRVAQRALNGWSPIIVDNTNMKLWEMFPYVKEGIKNGYLIRLLEPRTPWAKSVGQLAKRNKHQVPGDSISRMLTNYENASVEDLLRAMKMLTVSQPQSRIFPQIKPSSSQDAVTADEQSKNDPVQGLLDPGGTNNDDWVAFEDEQKNFWNTKPQSIPKTLTDKVPAAARISTQGDSASNPGANNIFELLREAKVEADQNEDIEKSQPLEKHEKNCFNENGAFQQIRTIYPSVPISLLWDLFEKCNGDGDWTMDILLNENFIDGIRKLASDEAIERDNFVCSCRSSTVSNELLDAAKAIPVELLADFERPSTSSYQPPPPRAPRRVAKAIQKSESDDVRRLIEEQFVISDEHYSAHTRKIRDFRRNQSAPNTEIRIESMDTAPDGIAEVDQADCVQEEEEMVEVDLGINLICQLDSTFGTSAIQAENLRNINTTVFLPRSLGQQLYATWLESLFHQVEEQRLKMVRDDETFAKELQQKEAPQSKHKAAADPPQNNLNEFVDMAYAWSAYKTDDNEWRQTSPENLAMKLTKAKLFEIFPNMDRETLVDVFTSNGNNFEKTVEILRSMLPTDVDEKIRSAGESLLNQVREEARMVILEQFR